MEPWYRVVTPRKEVREGRSFNPDEFAIALDQVVDGKAPADYQDPEQFFSRTYFTQSLSEHTGMILRRLSGGTEGAAPVLSLITQFGGGKTHTLTSLYHIARAGRSASGLTGVEDLLKASGTTVPDDVRVATFVGNAWDPKDGIENPWIDVARQIAGERGVDALGATARTSPPGTRALGDVFDAAEAPVLILFDEVLNFINRHGSMADHFYAFLQNLTVAVAGTTRAAAVVSLPRSQTEMTESDLEWQERITKVVNRVAQDLIANDESEISEVIRRRLFENLGSERTGGGSPTRTPTGASKDPTGSRPSGPPWTRPPTRTGPRNPSGRGSRPAIRSTRQRSRSSRGSGAPCPSSRRPGDHWRCWHSGSRQHPASSSSRHGTNR